MNNQVQNNEEKTVAVINEIQIKQFQSLYYLFKGKRDTDIKLFDDNKQFTYFEIIELNNKIYKKLALHEKITDLINVTVGLDKNEIRTFGNWHEFTQTDWNISSRTKYISIEWDFNIILPNQSHKVPQTHTLRVRIGNNLKPSEMIQVVFQGSEEYELEEIQSQMVCKIDFVNSQICSRQNKFLWLKTSIIIKSSLELLSCACTSKLYTELYTGLPTKDENAERDDCTEYIKPFIVPCIFLITLSLLQIFKKNLEDQN